MKYIIKILQIKNYIRGRLVLYPQLPLETTDHLLMCCKLIRSHLRRIVQIEFTQEGPQRVVRGWWRHKGHGGGWSRGAMAGGRRLLLSLRPAGTALASVRATQVSSDKLGSHFIGGAVG